jgi:hypothetical protein
MHIKKEFTMDETTSAIAARCLEDPAFARQVLEGDDYPAVRGAIVADIKEEQSVTGYLNPQPLPPGPSDRFAISSWARQVQLWNNWNTLSRVTLNNLIIRR